MSRSPFLSNISDGDTPSRRCIPLTTVILTYNESRNIESCLRSLHGWIDDLFVVDSGSTDNTCVIAEQYGAVVIRHPFETHALQWQWALEHVPAAYPWCMGLDADQWVTDELKEALIQQFMHHRDDLDRLDGLYVNRRQIFRGRWIRHGGYYPKYLLKIFKRDKVRINPKDLVDHHFHVDGPVLKLRYDLIEENHKEDDISFWLEKHLRYAELMAREESQDKDVLIKPALSGTPDQRTAWLKKYWKRIPLYIRPFFYFFYRYVLRFGFLDGQQGLIFHFMQACWFRLLVDIHLSELRQAPGQEKQRYKP